ncbi:MAG: YdcH family protein [Xanthomonadales bacterium]|jgi:hypothetical protein|nr:YdcH family protein [Xanthomonadales bacterium]
MWSEDPGQLALKLLELRERHRDLDHLIEHLSLDPLSDQLALRRFKKEKLRLKDQIGWIENRLIPDEPA